MRNACLAAIVGVVVPGAAGAQDLGPRTVLPMHVQCAAMPVTAAPAVTLTVAASERGDGRQVLSLGELAVIPAGTTQGLSLGQTLAAHHVDRGRANSNGNWDGREGVRFGRDGYYGGTRAIALLTVERIDAQFALARIVKVCDQVEVGDRLEPVVLTELPTAAGAGQPDFSDRALVLFGRDLREVFGDGDVLSIDRGSNHGVTAGTRFALYHNPKNGMPLSERGEAVVLDVTETTARAVIVRIREFVSIGDTAVRVVSTQP